MVQLTVLIWKPEDVDRCCDKLVWRHCFVLMCLVINHTRCDVVYLVHSVFKVKKFPLCIMLFQIRITYFCLWVTKHPIINFLESYPTDCVGFSGNLALFCEVRGVIETIFAETNTLVSLVTSTDNRGEISRKKLACIAVIVSQFHRSILINNSCLLKKKKKGAPPKMVIQVLKREGPTPLRAGDLSADPRPAEVKARPATGQSQPLLAGHSNETRPCCCVNYLHSPKALRPYR